MWHLGERNTTLYFACHFVPSGTRLPLSSEVHLQIPNILPDWKCPSPICFKHIFPTLSSRILCNRLLDYPLYRHKQLRNKELGLPAWGQEKCPRQFPNQNPHLQSANQLLNPFQFQPEVQRCLLPNVSCKHHWRATNDGFLSLSLTLLQFLLWLHCLNSHLHSPNRAGLEATANAIQTKSTSLWLNQLGLINH